MSASEEIVLEKAHQLAGSCARAGVRDNQLSQVLAHLKRHQDVRATRNLLESLRRSPFASRTGSSPRQYKALHEHVGTVFAWTSNWQDAARVVGWAKRLWRWAESQHWSRS